MPTDTNTSPRPRLPRYMKHEKLKPRLTPFGLYLVEAIEAARLNINLFCALVSERTGHAWHMSRFQAMVLRPDAAPASLRNRKSRGASDHDLWAFAAVLKLNPIEMFTVYYGVSPERQETFSYLWHTLMQLPEGEWADVIGLLESKARRLGISGPLSSEKK